MIRLVLAILALLFFIVLTLPLYLALLLIGIWYPKLRARIGQPAVKFAFWLLLGASGVKIKARGLENIPDEPVLYAANHRGFFDIPIMYMTVPHLTGFVAKKQIKKVPVLSWWMAHLNCLFLDRDDFRQAMKMMLDGIELIRNGSSICIMPEGTRNHGDELLPFREGSFKMAEKTGCPIVPVAMWKTDEIFELHMPKIKAQTVTIYYGEPIRINELSKEDRKHLGALVRDRVESMLQEIR